jgi:hypothetical protein
MTNWASRTQPQSRRSLFGTTWHVKWLAQMFQSGSGQESLQFTNSDDADIEVLPVINTDGSVVIMISNHAVASPNDNNGSGFTAKVSLDVTSLGSFTSARQLMIDAGTSSTAGPSATSISAQSPITVAFSGYGVAIHKTAVTTAAFSFFRIVRRSRSQHLVYFVRPELATLNSSPIPFRGHYSASP